MTSTSFDRAVPYLLSVAGMLVGLAGCQSFAVKTPDGFVKYRDSSDYYLAVSPENSLIVVRSRENDPRGSLEYWKETLKRDFTKVRKYKLLGEARVENAQGKKGAQMRFMGSHRGRTFAYYLTVFVTKDKIYTVEALATKDDLERRQDAFEKVVSSLKFL